MRFVVFSKKMFVITIKILFLGANIDPSQL